MKKKKRHHRRIHEPITAQQRVIEAEPSATPIITESLSPRELSTAAIVKKELWSTLITTGILVLLLIIASMTNSRTHWTVLFGNELYRWLHIR